MLLDSGATLPSLYEGDLPKLGIDRTKYAAQSARTVNTADSVLYARVYELDVSVLGGDGNMPFRSSSSSGSANHTRATTPPPVMAKSTETIPEHEHEETTRPNKRKKTPTLTPSRSVTLPDPEPLSSTIPVLVFAGDSDDLAGDQVPGRLSGLLPFHVCYFSGAPGTFKLWMGEDRRDVLGAGRLPGQMRYGEILGGVNALENAKRKVASSSSSSSSSVAAPASSLSTQRAKGGGRLEEWWERYARRTPERVIFEHELPDARGGGVLREEDVGDGSVCMTGPRDTDFDDAQAKSEGVKVLRVKRKSFLADHATQLPQNLAKRPMRRLTRSIAEDDLPS